MILSLCIVESFTYFFVLPDVRNWFKKIMEKCCGSDNDMTVTSDNGMIRTIT